MIHIELEKESNEIAFDIDYNFRTAILGENGIGKSTILRAIAHKSSQHDWLNVEVPKNLRITYFSQIEKNKSVLSGGEHTKQRLDKLFSESADVYILDEPTNNLDSKNITWLKKYILKNRLQVVFTSHDIDFINEIAEVIFYLDSKGVEKTKEKCSSYLVTRRKKIERAFITYEDNLKKQKDLLHAAQHAKQRSESGSKWKGTDNDKFLRGFNRNAAGESASTARKLKERAEEMKVEKPHYDPIPRVNFQKGDFNNNLFNIHTTTLRQKRINFMLNNDNKILFCGENGTGKTTLVKYLTSLLEKGDVREGDIFNIGGKFSYIYISQNWYEDLDEVPVVDYLSRFNLSERDMYNSLSYNHLDRKIINKKFKDLSPGVRIKVLLGMLSNKKFDLIIWDEPTNHLDVMAQSILLNAFVDYKGALVIISHDKQILSEPKFIKFDF